MGKRGKKATPGRFAPDHMTILTGHHECSFANDDVFFAVFNRSTSHLIIE